MPIRLNGGIDPAIGVGRGPPPQIRRTATNHTGSRIVDGVSQALKERRALVVVGRDFGCIQLEGEFVVSRAVVAQDIQVIIRTILQQETAPGDLVQDQHEDDLPARWGKPRCSGRCEM